jgi:hypothetical protein
LLFHEQLRKVEDKAVIFYTWVFRGLQTDCSTQIF